MAKNDLAKVYDDTYIGTHKNKTAWPLKVTF